MEEQILPDLTQRNVYMALKEKLIGVCPIPDRNWFICLQVDRSQWVEEKHVTLTFLDSINQIFWCFVPNLFVFAFLSVWQIFKFEGLFIYFRHRTFTVVWINFWMSIFRNESYRIKQVRCRPCPVCSPFVSFEVLTCPTSVIGLLSKSLKHVEVFELA